MRVKAITVYSHESPRLEALRLSAAKSGVELMAIQTSWKGFGTKIIELRNYLKTIQGEYTHFIFVDAYDTLFLKYPQIPDKILFSTEKHKWPDVNAAYQETNEAWPYLNSGCYCAPIDAYLELTEKYPCEYDIDDQRYFTNIYLNDNKIELDTKCEIFQSYAFESEGDFTLNPFKNNVNNTSASVIHFNGKCYNEYFYNMIKYATLNDLQSVWADKPEVHKEINESFADLVNLDPELKSHRDFVDKNVFGFGERSFQWMWSLIVGDMPKAFTFLEIGVFKGQVLSLIELLASRQGKKAKRYGVTPLSTEGGVWESDYEKDIDTIHDEFKLDKKFTILKGLSESTDIISSASKLKLDILFIDGGHEERHIRNDIVNYAPLVKSGAFMVIDDCCNTFHMPFGYFQGIESVSKVVDELLPPHAGSNEWEFVASVVHNRIYRRK
jgi:hypothetical protein